MNDFEKLKNMDITEIHRQTRITLTKLQDIINKNFENMDSATRTYGFIKILERELYVNLQDWIDEYNYYREHGNTKNFSIKTQESLLDKTSLTHTLTPSHNQDSISQDSMGLNSQKQQDNQTSLQPQESDKHIVISVSQRNATKQTDLHEREKASPNISQNDMPQHATSQYYTAPNNPAKRENTARKQQFNGSNIEVSMSQAKSSAKSFSVFIAGIIVVLCGVGVYFITSKVPHSESTEAIQQNNIQKQIVEKEIHQAEQTQSAVQENAKNTTNQAIDSANITQVNATQTTQSQTQQNDVATSKPQKYTLTIIPKSKVWFAWIDTIAKKRGDKFTQSAFTMEISDKTAFHFGNALLTLEVNGKKYDYNQKSVVYMIYDAENGFKTITQKEYRALGGK